MKNLDFVIVLALLSGFMTGCSGRKTPVVEPASPVATESEPDSTLYGECGEGTAMHTLQLITDVGDTLELSLMGDDDVAAEIQGGLMTGDKMAVVAKETDGGRMATHVINMTTLLGRWTSIDKNFTIEEGGTVKSNVAAENKPWVSWKIFNGKLILNQDTFRINSLGADSLFLENDKGIYVYKRQK